MKNSSTSSLQVIKIANYNIGDNYPVFIIAEAGVNHNGDLLLAKELIDIAKEANASAVKFQTFKVEELVSSKEKKQFNLLKKLQLKDEDFYELTQYAHKKNIIFLSTPFDESSADLLEKLKIPAFKISSADITNLPLIKHIAKKNLPLIVSTGMATLEEIEEAINTIKSVKNEDIILLHCTSSYPTSFDEVNLRAICTLRERFQLPIGYSDHTLGWEISLAAVAIGARVIEKHFTVNKNLPGPDHKISLEPHELKEMITKIRQLEEALGEGKKVPTQKELALRSTVRRSLVAKINIPKGTPIKREYIGIKRPEGALLPKYIDEVIKKKAKVDIEKDEPLSWDKLI